MNIADYLKDAAISQQQFAALVGVTQGRVSQWIAGERVPAERVQSIEDATGGKVSRHDLRPDLFPTPPAQEAA